MPLSTPKTPKKMGRPPLIDGPMAPLVQALGSVTALAAELGVNVTTIGRWDAGTVSPSSGARVLMAIVAAKHGLPAPFGKRGET